MTDTISPCPRCGNAHWGATQPVLATFALEQSGDFGELLGVGELLDEGNWTTFQCQNCAFTTEFNPIDFEPEDLRELVEEGVN